MEKGFAWSKIGSPTFSRPLVKQTLELGLQMTENRRSKRQDERNGLEEEEQLQQFNRFGLRQNLSNASLELLIPQIQKTF